MHGKNESVHFEAVAAEHFEVAAEHFEVAAEHFEADAHQLPAMVVLLLRVPLAAQSPPMLASRLLLLFLPIPLLLELPPTGFVCEFLR